jgi:hypothetical protein
VITVLPVLNASFTLNERSLHVRSLCLNYLNPGIWKLMRCISTDASKTPPSRFQQRKGSVYATPGSRDGHTDKNKDRDKLFHDKVKEFGTGLWGKRRKSSSKGSDAVEKKTDGAAEEK